MFSLMILSSCKLLVQMRVCVSNLYNDNVFDCRHRKDGSAGKLYTVK